MLHLSRSPFKWCLIYAVYSNEGLAIFAGRIYKFASPPTCWDTSVGNVTSIGLMTGVRFPARNVMCTFCGFESYKIGLRVRNYILRKYISV